MLRSITNNRFRLQGPAHGVLPRQRTWTAVYLERVVSPLDQPFESACQITLPSAIFCKLVTDTNSARGSPRFALGDGFLTLGADDSLPKIRGLEDDRTTPKEIARRPLVLSHGNRFTRVDRTKLEARELVESRDVAAVSGSPLDS